jgi:hypothetical protein
VNESLEALAEAGSSAAGATSDTGVASWYEALAMGESSKRVDGGGSSVDRRLRLLLLGFGLNLLRSRNGGGGDLRFVAFLLEVTADVVQDEVAIGLFGEEERLGELAPGSASVRHLADNLNDDAALRRALTVNIADVDLAVFEAERHDLVVNFLLERSERNGKRNIISLVVFAEVPPTQQEAHLLAIARNRLLALGAVDHRRPLGVEAVQTGRVLVEETVGEARTGSAKRWDCREVDKHA